MIITKKLIFLENVEFYSTNDQNWNYQMKFQKYKNHFVSEEDLDLLRKTMIVI